MKLSKKVSLISQYNLTLVLSVETCFYFTEPGCEEEAASATDDATSELKGVNGTSESKNVEIVEEAASAVADTTSESSNVETLNTAENKDTAATSETQLEVDEKAQTKPDPPVEEQKLLDLAFAMDCTGSMGSYINQAQQVTQTCGLKAKLN